MANFMDLKIPFSNCKPSIHKYVLDQWQTLWNNSIGNKLLEIKPTIGEHQSVVRNIKKRRNYFGLTPLRSNKSHTRILTNRWRCGGCDAPFTVRLILLECGDFWWGKESWLLSLSSWCLLIVVWLFLACHGFVCSLWFWYFLIILTIFAQVRNNCFHVDNMKQLFQINLLYFLTRFLYWKQ